MPSGALPMPSSQTGGGRGLSAASPIARRARPAELGYGPASSTARGSRTRDAIQSMVARITPETTNVR